MKQICLLYTSAGAGHKSVAKALAVELSSDPQVKVETVDFSQEYHLPGFNKSENSYKFILKFFPWLQGFIVWLVDLRLPMNIIRYSYKLAARKHFKQFLQEHPAAVYLSTSYFDIPLFQFIKKTTPGIKVIMLVTDIVHPLRIWFDPAPDMTIVPTQELYKLGLKYFLNYREKIKVMGLPISPIFYKNINPDDFKKALGLPLKQTLLLSGGGEGMNQVPEILYALDQQLTDTNICVVCGKDKLQKGQLEKHTYKNNVFILGWTDKFAEYLIASDLVIAKAGPTTIWEAMTAGKKTILYDYIRGQEDGNIEFAQKYFGAKYLTDPVQIATDSIRVLQEKLIINANQYLSNWTKIITQLL